MRGGVGAGLARRAAHALLQAAAVVARGVEEGPIRVVVEMDYVLYYRGRPVARARAGEVEVYPGMEALAEKLAPVLPELEELAGEARKSASLGDWALAELTALEALRRAAEAVERGGD